MMTRVTTTTTTTTRSECRHSLLCVQTNHTDGLQGASGVEEMTMTTGEGMIGASLATAPRPESAGMVLWVEGHTTAGTGLPLDGTGRVT